MIRRDFVIGTAATCAASLCGTTNGLAKEKVKTADELINSETQKALDKSLRYLASRQRKSGATKGAFGTTGYPAGVAVTALSGLAFLCSGSSPVGGPYAANIRACTDFLVSNINSEGYITSPHGRSNMYGHGFAMLYLSQVLGMSSNPEIDDKLRKAVEMTCSVQNDRGGWRYQPQKVTGDLSITICQIMGLRGAHDAGIEVSDKVRSKCIEFVKRCQNRDGSFHYTLSGGRTSFALTAAGVVSLNSAGIYNGEEVEKALDWMRKRKPGKIFGSGSQPDELLLRTVLFFTSDVACPAESS